MFFLALTLLRIVPRPCRDEPDSGSTERSDPAERRASAFLFWFIASSIVWVLGTDALLDWASAPGWLGSLKDILYLTACGLALRRAVAVHLEGVRQIHREQTEAKLDLIERLAMASEYRDDETGGHNRRIAEAARAVGRELGMSGKACEHLFYAAAMHDLGKIAVPDRILHKRGPLRPEERELMQAHAWRGARLLANSPHPLLLMAHDVALSHHERWDGGGYPHGLKGEAIPLSARIVAVCDVFDALRSERPYKRAWRMEEAIEEIRRGSGTHFDPQVVEAFLRSLSRVNESEGTDGSERVDRAA